MKCTSRLNILLNNTSSIHYLFFLWKTEQKEHYWKKREKKGILIAPNKIILKILLILDATQ